MANGYIEGKTQDERTLRWEAGDFALLSWWPEYRLRRLRYDLGGTEDAPTLYVEAQTDKPGHRFSIAAHLEYDTTPDSSGIARGFAWKSGQIWSDDVRPVTVDFSWDLMRWVRGGEEKFFRANRFHRRVGSSTFLPRPVQTGGIRFGGRALMPERSHNGQPGSTAIVVTDQSWYEVVDRLACTCCGDDIVPIDTTTGKPLTFDGDPFCVTCWKSWTTRTRYAEANNMRVHDVDDRDVDSSNVTPPPTVPRFLLLHANQRGPARIEAVEFDPARPFRSGPRGIYNFALQRWTCSNLVDHDGMTEVCAATTPAVNPADWTRCSGCKEWLIFT